MKAVIYRNRKLIISATAAVVLYALLGFFLAPWLVTTNAIDSVRDNLNAELRLQRVAINPFVLSLTIDGLEFDDPGGLPLARVEQVFVNFQLSSLFRWALTFDEIRLDAPELFLSRDEAGELNIAFLTSGAKAGSENGAEAEMSSLMPLLVFQFEIKNSVLNWSDQVPTDPVELLDDAHVGGDARLRVRDEDRLERAAGARVDGEVEFLALPEEFEETRRYASGKFYLWQIARLISAVLVGVALFWLIPGFRNVAVSGGLDGLKTAGIGLVTLVSVPIIAAIIAITLVGLPFSFIAVIAWLLLIYLAKVVVGAFVGRMMLRSTRYGENIALVLLAGIAAILVAINLPAIGGVINFLLTIVGMGLIVQRMFVALSERDSAQP